MNKSVFWLKPILFIFFPPAKAGGNSKIGGNSKTGGNSKDRSKNFNN